MANTSKNNKNAGKILNDYELQRINTMANNHQRLKNLGVEKLENSYLGRVQSAMSTKQKVSKTNNNSKDLDYTPEMDCDDVSTDEDQQPVNKKSKQCQRFIAPLSLRNNRRVNAPSSYSNLLRSPPTKVRKPEVTPSIKGSQTQRLPIKENGLKTNKTAVQGKQPLLNADKDDEVNEESMDVFGFGNNEAEVNLNTTKGTEVPIEEADREKQAELTDFEDEQHIDKVTTRKQCGITCGKGARQLMRTCNQRLPLEFDFKTMRVISECDSAFMHECGYIVRNDCSFGFKDWRHVPVEVRLPLRHKLTTLFDIDVENANVCKVIDSYMARAWRIHKARLHSHFKDIEGSKNLTKTKASPPSNITKEDWEFLCDMWSDPDFLKIAKKRVEARQSRKRASRNGSKSTIRYHLELGYDLDSSTGHIETWRLMHWDEKKGWTSEDAAATYDEIMKLRDEHSVESMSDKSILEKVLGRSSVRLNGWGRDPTFGRSNTNRHLDRASNDDLKDEVESLKNTCALLKKVLTDNNLMPTITTTTEASQRDTSELEE